MIGEPPGNQTRAINTTSWKSVVVRLVISILIFYNTSLARFTHTNKIQIICIFHFPFFPPFTGRGFQLGIRQQSLLPYLSAQADKKNNLFPGRKNTFPHLEHLYKATSPPLVKPSSWTSPDGASSCYIPAWSILYRFYTAYTTLPYHPHTCNSNTFSSLSPPLVKMKARAIDRPYLGCVVALPAHLPWSRRAFVFHLFLCPSGCVCITGAGGGNDDYFVYPMRSIPCLHFPVIGTVSCFPDSVTVFSCLVSVGDFIRERLSALKINPDCCHSVPPRFVLPRLWPGEESNLMRSPVPGHVA